MNTPAKAASRFTLMEGIMVGGGALVLVLTLWLFFSFSSQAERDMAWLDTTGHISSNLLMAHLQLGELIGGDAEVDPTRDVLNPLEESAESCQALLVGGSSHFGPVSAVPGGASQEAVTELCEAIRTVEVAAQARSAQSGSLTAVEDREFDRLMSDALGAGEIVHEEISVQIERDRRILLAGEWLGVALLAFVLVGMTWVVLRRRRTLERRNVELERIEHALRGERVKLDEAQRVGRVGSWEWDIVTGRTTWSAGLYRLFGMDPDGFTPSYESYLGMVHPDDRDRVEADLGRAVEERDSFEHDVRILSGSGEWLDFRAHAEVATDEAGAPVRMVGTATEITERVQAEQALAANVEELARSNAELEQFASVASHDLQEPLRMVTNYVQLLGHRYAGQLDDDADEFIEYAVDGARRMQALINDLLEYSRVGQGTPTRERIDTGRVLEEVLADLRVAIEQSGAEVMVSVDMPILVADRGQLVQVFRNLVGNALKFTGEEPPRVEVRAERIGDEWRFLVRDNGIGIDSEYADRIFVIFQRLQTRRQYQGTGVGLAICKKIIERHGGRIGVKTEPGRGSTFWFTLPVERNDADAA